MLKVTKINYFYLFHMHKITDIPALYQLKVKIFQVNRKKMMHKRHLKEFPIKLQTTDNE